MHIYGMKNQTSINACDNVSHDWANLILCIINGKANEKITIRSEVSEEITHWHWCTYTDTDRYTDRHKHRDTDTDTDTDTHRYTHHLVLENLHTVLSYLVFRAIPNLKAWQPETTYIFKG